MDLASAEAEIRHVFGDTPITEASIGAAPPDILVKLSGQVPLREQFVLSGCVISRVQFVISRKIVDTKTLGIDRK